MGPGTVVLLRATNVTIMHALLWQRINGLKEELDYERDERVRIEDEHTESVQPA